jgi:hypothetical protein
MKIIHLLNKLEIKYEQYIFQAEKEEGRGLNP